MGILVSNGCSFTYGDELPGTRLGFDSNGTPIPETHHHLTFTDILSKKLKIDYVNLAENGSSNQKIFRRTTSFLQNTSKKVDYLVIIWSSWGRLEVCRKDPVPEDSQMYIGTETNMSQIIPNHHSGKLKFLLNHWTSVETDKSSMQAAKDWYEHVYSMQTAIVHHLNYMRIIQEMCDLKGIKVIQGVIHYGMWQNVLSTMKYANKVSPRMNEYLNYVIESLRYLRPECKLGLGDDRDLTTIAKDPKNNFFLYPIGHPCEGTHRYYAEMLYELLEGIENVTN